MSDDKKNFEFYSEQIKKFIKAPSDSFKIEISPEIEEEVKKNLYAESLNDALKAKNIPKQIYYQAKSKLESLSGKKDIPFEEIINNPIVEKEIEENKKNYVEGIKKREEEQKDFINNRFYISNSQRAFLTSKRKLTAFKNFHKKLFIDVSDKNALSEDEFKQKFDQVVSNAPPKLKKVRLTKASPTTYYIAPNVKNNLVADRMLTAY